MQAVFMKFETRVLVYNGEGASLKCIFCALRHLQQSFISGVEISTLSATELLQGKWQDSCLLLVMPGGADLPYCKYLNGRGNELIKEYVRGGGAYLGICAGAYYASHHVEFDHGGPLEVLGDRELAFFPGTAVGPAFPGFDYMSARGTNAAALDVDTEPLRRLLEKVGTDVNQAYITSNGPKRKIEAAEKLSAKRQRNSSDKGPQRLSSFHIRPLLQAAAEALQDLKLGEGLVSNGASVSEGRWLECVDYCNGGPIFVPSAPDWSLDQRIRALSCYAELDNSLACVRMTVGSGVAIMCGTHPEMDITDYDLPADWPEELHRAAAGASTDCIRRADNGCGTHPEIDMIMSNLPMDGSIKENNATASIVAHDCDSGHRLWPRGNSGFATDVSSTSELALQKGCEDPFLRHHPHGARHHSVHTHEGAQTSEEGCVVLQESDLGEEGCVVLQESDLGEEGCVVLQESDLGEEGCVVLQESDVGEEGCVVLQESELVEEKCVVLQESELVEEKCVVLQESDPVEEGCVVLQERELVEEGCVVLQERELVEERCVVLQEEELVEEGCVVLQERELVEEGSVGLHGAEGIREGRVMVQWHQQQSTIQANSGDMVISRNNEAKDQRLLSSSLDDFQRSTTTDRLDTNQILISHPGLSDQSSFHTTIQSSDLEFAVMLKNPEHELHGKGLDEEVARKLREGKVGRLLLWAVILSAFCKE